MRTYGLRQTALLGAVLLLVTSMALGSLLALPQAAPVLGNSAAEPAAASSAASPSASAATPSSAAAASLSDTHVTSFSQRIRDTAEALAAAGVPARDIRLPYAGTAAQVEDGHVVPGYAVQAANVSFFGSSPTPFGVSYYGESDPSGHVEATILNASSVAGSLTVNSLQSLYLDVNTPDMWGIQLNAVMPNVTLSGHAVYQFWTQNAVDIVQSNSTINLGEDTWNFSSPSAFVPTGTSTILSHSPNGSVVGGLYIGEGPWLYAPAPFTLTLYLNSSLTPLHDQQLWYNYSLTAAGGIAEHGTYDWVIFNSGGASDTPVAAFQANGEHLDPVFLTNDFEFDYGIGVYNGATMDVLSADVTASLDYCPATVARCTAETFESVPAAVDFGGETGETSSGLAATYVGTTEFATAGPNILRGLWGFAGGEGAADGTTVVSNDISTSGAPDGGSTPYAFVFFQNESLYDHSYEWAPDVPDWNLAPGTYSYEVLLSDYAEQTGTLVVGATPTALTAVLPYDPSSGVYTPLWAFSNAQLAGISSSGNGAVGSQYVLFNNPTSSCTACGGAPNNNLSGVFYSYNDYVYPTFTGILLDGTNDYVDVASPPTFTVNYLRIAPGAWWDFDLQLAFVDTSQVTLSHAAKIGGWPGLFEVESLAGLVPSTDNLFPQASVEVWDSSDDLIAGNTFVSTPVLIPTCNDLFCNGPSPGCYFICVSPDGLLLYGGSANTVWGNTFRNLAPGYPPENYTALAEAESGDLIYNNNFSAANPTVWLPYDIYTDACPDGYAGDCGPPGPAPYADRWNVTPQAASAVSATVNGFPLSGNILDPSCPTQGGNFWSTYGDALNPFGSLPMTNRWNYSADAGAVALPSDGIESSIRTGGDYAPLTVLSCLPTNTDVSVKFHATGLPAGAAWSVTLQAGERISATTPTTTVSLPTHDYGFNASGPVYYELAKVSARGAKVTYTSIDVTRKATVTLRFGLLVPVSFSELIRPRWPGLPNGTQWSVSVVPTSPDEAPGINVTTLSSAIHIGFVQGTSYRYVVDVPDGYVGTPTHGRLVIPDQRIIRPITKEIRFAPAPAPEWASGGAFALAAATVARGRI